MTHITTQNAGERGAESPRRDPEPPSPILSPGRTCWRIEPTERAAFLVDGEAYFKAFCDAALRAKHSMMIVGWDIDTQVELVRETSASSEMPTPTGEGAGHRPAHIRNAASHTGGDTQDEARAALHGVCIPQARRVRAASRGNVLIGRLMRG